VLGDRLRDDEIGLVPEGNVECIIPKMMIRQGEFDAFCNRCP